MRRGALTLVVWAGCATPPAVHEYAGELERAYCEWQTECHEYAAVDDCMAARSIDADPEFRYLAKAVAAGTAEYDGQAALACLDAMRGRGCVSDDAATPSECDAVFRGRIGRNGPCMSSLECVGDAVCGFDPRCTDACCPGACRVFADPLAEGEACGGGVACAEGLFCGFDPVTFVSTVCTPAVKVGGACGNGEQCVEEAYCDGAECRAWQLRAPGQTCGEQGQRCEEPADCHGVPNESGEYVQLCVAPALVGAPCDPDDYGGCARFDTYCEPTAKLCKLLPIPGAACSPEGCVGYASCQGGIGYDEYDEPLGSPGTCVAKAGRGERCGDVAGDGSSYVECLGELWCDDSRSCAFYEQPGASRFDCAVPEDG
jgi:hypothetical protein